MTQHSKRRYARSKATLALVAASTALITALPRAQAVPPVRRLDGHLPPLVASSRLVEHIAPSAPIQLALALPLRNQAQLDALLRRLYDPNDPAYGHYLTPQQFTAAFGPTQADYQAVMDYAQAHGLTITGTHPNRLLLDVTGPAAAVENAFGVRLQRYQAPDGRLFRAPDAEPVVPAEMANRLVGIVGLDTAVILHPHNFGWPVDPLDSNGLASPLEIGTGPGGAMTPTDIKAAYNLNGTTANGAGQTLAVFELDGYTPSDITGYVNAYGLPTVPLQNVLVDGVSGTPGNGAGEVTLDIELQIALAPGASQILVYEGPNSLNGVMDTYNRIATDNLAKEVSTSWGVAENSSLSSFFHSEFSIFQQMAAQGQSIFSASGDYGAYQNGSTLSVDDPASQPYVVGVGGTTLTTSGPGGAWQSETTWNNGSPAAGAGGGGISVIWSIPSYQSGVVPSASLGSTSMRNVPDVALDANPNTGYSVYYQGSWYVYGGTSCAAPLWAAFTALANQQRVAAGSSLLGFLNPALYTIGQSSYYTSNFHDISDNSTNLYYPAVSGYDDATGWGSINAANLLPSLVTGTPTGSGGGGGSTPGQLLGNPGFENGAANPAPWVTSTNVIDNSSVEPAHSGQWKAWLDGYGTAHTDTLYQQVSIPATINSATLSFWLHIDTARTTTSATDTLKVQIRNASGSVLKNLATYSNLNHNTGYTQVTFNLTAYKGKTIQVYLIGSEKSGPQTSFVVDDFALNVQ